MFKASSYIFFLSIATKVGPMLCIDVWHVSRVTIIHNACLDTGLLKQAVVRALFKLYLPQIACWRFKLVRQVEIF